ncbi:MAG: glycosyltransferase family 2 protein [Candidatus Taylorbacteria bacterium]|nr:glycosyltransferase family 2 protein [Candidatus Taylorbacteria bacterium]
MSKVADPYVRRQADVPALTDFSRTPYFKVGKASDLAGFDRFLYRSFEMLPGALSWGTIIFVFLLSYFMPTYSAFFIIAFNFYWVAKSAYFSFHLRYNWKRVKHNLAADWESKLSAHPYTHLRHLILLPFYNEEKEIVERNLKSLLEARYEHAHMFVVLAGEERAGDGAREIGRRMLEKYSGRFGDLIFTVHPSGVPGELAGKGANISYAIEEARKRILDKRQIAYRDVIVSAFDIDTIVYPDYFLCLTWHFLTAPDPHRSSFQPVPLFNNNIWLAPAFSRVVSYSGSIWQMIQQERPERLYTFSSHSISFLALWRVGYWQKNIVPEDSRIFWNAFFAFGGDYKVVPLSYPVSLDAASAPSFWQTVKNVYKQQRRWSWHADIIPYMLMGFLKSQVFSFRKAFISVFAELERIWSLATNPVLLILLSWMPLVLGGGGFQSTVLFYNMPLFSKFISVAALMGLGVSAAVSFSFLPPPPAGLPRRRKLWMILQWLLVPITLIAFGSLPALDAQTRLMLGKYMGFWATPKYHNS